MVIIFLEPPARSSVQRQDLFMRSQLSSYEVAVHWIATERSIGRGHPPRDRMAVSGWVTVRLVAKLYNKAVREVAGDVVDYSVAMDDMNQQRSDASEKARLSRIRRAQGGRASG